MTVGIDFKNGGVDAGRLALGIEDADRILDPGMFAGTEHGPPLIRRDRLEEEDFENAFSFRVDSGKPGGNDAGIVEDEKIAGAKNVADIGKGAMGEGGAGAVEDEEPGLIAGRGGGMGDAVGGEKIIEIGSAHGGE